MKKEIIYFLVLVGVLAWTQGSSAQSCSEYFALQSKKESHPRNESFLKISQLLKWVASVDENRDEIDEQQISVFKQYASSIAGISHLVENNPPGEVIAALKIVEKNHFFCHEKDPHYAYDTKFLINNLFKLTLVVKKIVGKDPQILSELAENETIWTQVSERKVQDQKDQAAFVQFLDSLALQAGSTGAKPCGNEEAPFDPDYKLITGLTNTFLPHSTVSQPASTTGLSQEETDQLIYLVETLKTKIKALGLERIDQTFPLKDFGFPQEAIAEFLGDNRIYIYLPLFINKGSFKSLYKAVDYKNGELLARARIPVTVDINPGSPYQKLLREEKILNFVSGVKGFPKTYLIKKTETPRQDSYHEIVWPFYPADLLAVTENNSKVLGLQVQFSTKQKLKNAIDLLSALKFLHDNHIFHRDIKPDNVLMGLTLHGPKTVLTDFGLGIFFDDKDLVKRKWGTPLYFSPRFLSITPTRFEKEDDIWAMGLVLYSLEFGAKPDFIIKASKTDQYDPFVVEMKNLYIHQEEIKKDTQLAKIIPGENKLHDVIQGLLHPDQGQQMTLDRAIQILTTEYEKEEKL